MLCAILDDLVDATFVKYVADLRAFHRHLRIRYSETCAYCRQTIGIERGALVQLCQIHRFYLPRFEVCCVEKIVRCAAVCEHPCRDEWVVELDDVESTENKILPAVLYDSQIRLELNQQFAFLAGVCFGS